MGLRNKTSGGRWASCGHASWIQHAIQAMHGIHYVTWNGHYLIVQISQSNTDLTKFLDYFLYSLTLKLKLSPWYELNSSRNIVWTQWMNQNRDVQNNLNPSCNIFLYEYLWLSVTRNIICVSTKNLREKEKKKILMKTSCFDTYPVVMESERTSKKQKSSCNLKIKALIRKTR